MTPSDGNALQKTQPKVSSSLILHHPKLLFFLKDRTKKSARTFKILPTICTVNLLFHQNKINVFNSRRSVLYINVGHGVVFVNSSEFAVFPRWY